MKISVKINDRLRWFNFDAYSELTYSKTFFKKSVDWQFTTEQARGKLKHLYPVI
jgi:hypothetical protein